LAELDVERDKVPLVIRHIFFSVDGIDGALRDADRTVNALIGIDDQKIRSFTEAVDRADIDAVGVAALDAGFGDNVGHGDSIV
jgi:hypothetical protein